MEEWIRVEPLLQRAGVRDWGCCPYAAVREHLLPCRGLNRLPEGAQSILLAVFPYSLEESAYKNSNLSRYACVKDYHLVAMEYLRASCRILAREFPGHAFEPFADNSPIPEVRAAALAGLGVIGDHRLLITPRYGSWVFLGEIVTTLPVAPTGSGKWEACSHCGRCRSACPSGALEGGGFSRCLSGVTQKKGVLSPEEQQMIRRSGCAWGCDQCQTACGCNQGKQPACLPEFLTSFHPVARRGEPLEDKAYGWRGAAVIERNLALLETEREKEG